MRKDRLRKIAKHIVGEGGRRFLMHDWIQRKTSEGDKVWGDRVVGGDHQFYNFASCGTAACIGGWARLLFGRGEEHNESSERLLELDSSQSGIFYLSHWREDLRLRYDKAKTPLTRARIAVEEIEHLIKTGRVD